MDILNILASAVGGAFTIAIPAIVMLRKAWAEVAKSNYELEKTHRTDTILEWKEFANRLETEMERQGKELTVLRSDYAKLRDEHVKCQLDSVRQDTLIKMQQSTITQIQKELDAIRLRVDSKPEAQNHA